MPRASASQPKVVYAVASRRVVKKKKAPAPNIGRLRGHGAYTYDNPGPWGRIGSATGGMIGSALGTPYGLGKPASMIGKKLGSYLHYIGKIFGSGDYVTSSAGVNSNILMHGNDSHQIPSFGSGKQEVRIRHREYLGDILSSNVAGAFNLQSFALNPGLDASFPWLSQVCGATFQQYRINGMVFEFRSMSSDALNSTNTALGSVVMATDYDSKDNAFSSKQQMENTMFGVSCKPSSCMLHAIECARSQTSVSELYIRASDVPSGADIRLYDLGRFSIATQGCQGTNVNLGELWVSYDISLIKQIEQPPGFLNNYANFSLAGTDATKPLLVSNLVYSQPQFSNFPGPLSINAANTVLTLPLTLMPGSCYMMHFVIKGVSTASVTAPTVTFAGGLSQDLTGNGFSPKLILQGSTPSSAWAPTPPSTMNTCTVSYIFCYVGGGTLAVPPTITFSGTGVFPTGVTSGALILVQIPALPSSA